MKSKKRKPGIGLDLGRQWAIRHATMQELAIVVEDAASGEMGECGWYIIDYAITRMAFRIDEDEPMIDVNETFRIDFLAGVMSAIDEFAEAWPGYEHFAAA